MKQITRYHTIRIGPTLKEQGRKQRWLADQVGIHESVVSDWVNGRRTVDELRARQISKIMGVPFILLFLGTEVPIYGTERSAA